MLILSNGLQIKKRGIPAYIKIDMATQQTELVRLKEGMKYTPYDHFGRYLYRHLRFKYPTYMFDDINFEINEEGSSLLGMQCEEIQHRPFWRTDCRTCRIM